MIDTIQVLFPEVSISSSAALTVVPASRLFGSNEAQNEHCLFTCENGRAALGSKAFYNGKYLHLDIQPKNIAGQTMIYTSGHFSMPKVAHKGNNTKPCSEKEASKVMEYIQDELKLVGIDTDLNAARITRMDTFKNVESKQPFYEYKQLFEVLQMKRGSESIKRDYGSTFQQGNKSQQLVVYDKNEESKIQNERRKKQGLETFPLYDGNLIRFEQRIFKSKNVQSNVGVNTVSELLNNWDKPGEYYKKFMKDRIFNIDIQQMEGLLLENLKQQMDFFKTNYSRNWLQMFLMHKGLEGILSQVSFDALIYTLREDVELDKRKRNRFIQQLRNTQRVAVMAKKREVVSLKDLYLDLEYKLCG